MKSNDFWSRMLLVFAGVAFAAEVLFLVDFVTLAFFAMGGYLCREWSAGPNVPGTRTCEPGGNDHV